MRLAAILLLGVLGSASACASAPAGPFFNDDKYLRFGVDPSEEANAVIESQKERNYQLAHRLLGQHFTALGFMDKGGRSRAVRILTTRGVQVALDSRAEGSLEQPTSYALLAPPIKDTHDADHDGFEEVFVEERKPKESCVRVYRVRDVGFVDPVIVDTQLLGQEVCPRSVVDLDGDGVVELWSEVELGGFPIVGAAVPRLPLPLWADQHRFVARANTRPQRAWLARERAQREAALARARKELDVATCYVLAVELAGLAYLEQGDPAARLAAFDAALNGLVLTPAQAAVNLKARDRIFREWSEPKRTQPPRVVAYQPAAKEAARPAQRESRASKTSPVSESELQRALRAGASPRARSSAPANLDEPVLAEGEFVITPESAAEYQAVRRGPRPRTSTVATAPAPVAASAPAPARAASGASMPPPSAAELAAARAATRELGNSVVAERELAAAARKSAADARRAATEARTAAGQAKDPAVAAELRAKVAEHVAAAQRYVEEAAEHAATAARQREELLEQQARVMQMFSALAATSSN